VLEIDSQGNETRKLFNDSSQIWDANGSLTFEYEFDTAGLYWVRFFGDTDGDGLCGPAEPSGYATVSALDTTIDLLAYDYDGSGNRVEVPEMDEDALYGGSTATVNDDDDDDNDVKDMDQAPGNSQENDLQKVAIRQNGDLTEDVTLTYSSDIISVYENPDRTSPVESGTVYAPEDLTEDKILWVEGLSVSQAPVNAEVRADAGQDLSDAVYFTVIQFNLVLDPDSLVEIEDDLPAAVAALPAEMVTDVANAENCSGEGDDIDENSEEIGDPVDFTSYGFRVEVEDANIDGAATEVGFALPGGETYWLVADRAAGTNVFSSDVSNAPCVLVTGTPAPTQWPVGLQGVTKLVSETGQAFVEISRKKATAKRSPSHRAKGVSLSYYKIATAKDSSGYIINPPRIVKGEKSTFRIKTVSSASHIKWKLLSAPAGAKIIGAQGGVFTGTTAVIEGGTANGSFYILVKYVSTSSGRTRGKIRIPMEVVDWMDRNVYLYIINSATTQAKATEQIDIANVLWRQAGVRFTIEDIITPPQNDQWNSVSVNDRDDLMYRRTPKPGFRVFYVPQFIPHKYLGYNYARGILVDTYGINHYLIVTAHELGHALGKEKHLTTSLYHLMYGNSRGTDEKYDISSATALAVRTEANVGHAQPPPEE